MSNKPKRLYKSTTDNKILGICGGIAEYFNIDSSIIRIIFVFLFIFGSSGLWIYLILGVLPNDYEVNNNHKETPKEQGDNWDAF